MARERPRFQPLNPVAAEVRRRRPLRSDSSASLPRRLQGSRAKIAGLGGSLVLSPHPMRGEGDRAGSSGASSESILESGSVQIRAGNTPLAATAFPAKLQGMTGKPAGRSKKLVGATTLD